MIGNSGSGNNGTAEGVRLLALASLTVLSGTCLHADTWRNWGQSNITRQKVEVSVADSVRAGTDDTTGKFTLSIGCHISERPLGDGTFTSINNVFVLAGTGRNIDNGDPLFVSFDDAPRARLGSFGVYADAYTFGVGPQFWADLFGSEYLELSPEDMSFIAKFPLEGAQDAVSSMRCLETVE